MLPSQQSEVVLNAVTLRGIGSYIHGARLEVRPLTVLCGKNGSGKSTWLKALNLISTSLKSGKLPFGFDIADWDTSNIQVTNAFYHLASPEDHERLADDEATLKFGPPCTVGLEFQVVNDLELGPVMDGEIVASGKAQEFLRSGKCPKGTRFRIRIAHPGYWVDNVPTPQLADFVELEMDGRFAIQMRGERDSLQRYEAGYARPRRTKPYELYSCRDFLFGVSDDASELVHVGTVTDLVNLTCVPATEGVVSGQIAEVVQCFERRVLQLLQSLMAGYFYIGAVRQPQKSVVVADREAAQDPSVACQRYVGPTGEHAWLAERQHADRLMRAAMLGAFAPEELSGLKCLKLFAESLRSQDKRLSRIWELAAPEARERVAGLDVEATSEEEAAESIATLLNSVLERHDLLLPNCWFEPW